MNKTKSLLNMQLVCIYRMSNSNTELRGKECLGWERGVFTITYTVTTEHLLIESHVSRVMKEMKEGKEAERIFEEVIADNFSRFDDR